MMLMGKKISGYNDMRLDVTYQLKPKKIVPFDQFKEIVAEVRRMGLP
jgi:hypothetical protein